MIITVSLYVTGKIVLIRPFHLRNLVATTNTNTDSRDASSKGLERRQNQRKYSRQDKKTLEKVTLKCNYVDHWAFHTLAKMLNVTAFWDLPSSWKDAFRRTHTVCNVNPPTHLLLLCFDFSFPWNASIVMCVLSQWTIENEMILSKTRHFVPSAMAFITDWKHFPLIVSPGSTEGRLLCAETFIRTMGQWRAVICSAWRIDHIRDEGFQCGNCILGVFGSKRLLIQVCGVFPMPRKTVLSREKRFTWSPFEKVPGWSFYIPQWQLVFNRAILILSILWIRTKICGYCPFLASDWIQQGKVGKCKMTIGKMLNTGTR